MYLTVKAFVCDAEDQRNGCETSPYNDDIRKFVVERANCRSFDYLRAKLVQLVPELEGHDFTISWQDEEGDNITLSNDDELLVALLEAGANNLLKIKVTKNKALAANNKMGIYTDGIHHGVTCDGCGGQVSGHRYKCRVCPDYDLCMQCELAGRHDQHQMVRTSAVPSHSRESKLMGLARQSGVKFKKLGKRMPMQVGGMTGGGGSASADASNVPAWQKLPIEEILKGCYDPNVFVDFVEPPERPQVYSAVITNDADDNFRPMWLDRPAGKKKRKLPCQSPELPMEEILKGCYDPIVFMEIDEEELRKAERSRSKQQRMNRIKDRLAKLLSAQEKRKRKTAGVSEEEAEPDNNNQETVHNIIGQHTAEKPSSHTVDVDVMIDSEKEKLAATASEKSTNNTTTTSATSANKAAEQDEHDEEFIIVDGPPTPTTAAQRASSNSPRPLTTLAALSAMANPTFVKVTQTTAPSTTRLLTSQQQQQRARCSSDSVRVVDVVQTTPTSTSRSLPPSPVETPSATSPAEATSTTAAAAATESAAADGASTANTLDKQIAAAERELMAHGFTEDGGWLHKLIEAKQGDVAEVMKALSPYVR